VDTATRKHERANCREVARGRYAGRSRYSIKSDVAEHIGGYALERASGYGLEC
jgi:hypothetical protein